MSKKDKNNREVETEEVPTVSEVSEMSDTELLEGQTGELRDGNYAYMTECGNCKLTVAVQIPKGTKSTDFLRGVTCENCECKLRD